MKNEESAFWDSLPKNEKGEIDLTAMTAGQLSQYLEYWREKTAKKTVKKQVDKQVYETRTEKVDFDKMYESALKRSNESLAKLNECRNRGEEITIYGKKWRVTAIKETYLLLIDGDGSHKFMAFTVLEQVLPRIEHKHGKEYAIKVAQKQIEANDKKIAELLQRKSQIDDLGERDKTQRIINMLKEYTGICKEYICPDSNDDENWWMGVVFFAVIIIAVTIVILYNNSSDMKHENGEIAFKETAPKDNSGGTYNPKLKISDYIPKREIPDFDKMFQKTPEAAYQSEKDKLIMEGWTETRISNGRMKRCYNVVSQTGDIDNYLDVYVGGNTDVAIKIMNCSTNVCIRYVYVNSNTSYRVRNIPQGRYYLKIAYGKEWYFKIENGQCIGRFLRSPLYKKGDDILDYNLKYNYLGDGYDVPSYSVRLDIISSNRSNEFETTNITEDEFNR
ncbi:MAG: hypothetical protein LBQ01_04540 [Prevotellaceae bacterium]|jgi:hypothetical protein|nr:hypothetical protein [Prevotellaceae bacterium]